MEVEGQRAALIGHSALPIEQGEAQMFNVQ
jgi:hypothetical protein